MDNPQALVNPEARAQLQSLFEGVGVQGRELFEQLMSTLQNALNSALSEIFAVFFVVAVLALIAQFFLKGIPPHRPRQDEPETESKD